MGRAAEAEEAVFLRIGTPAQRSDACDPGSGEAMGDIGLQIELVMVRAAAIGEEAFVFGCLLDEAAQKGRVDLIAGARDARPDRGDDPVAAGAQCFHGEQGGIRDAAERPLPPGMRCAHDAGLGPLHTGNPPGRKGGRGGRGGLRGPPPPLPPPGPRNPPPACSSIRYWPRGRSASMVRPHIIWCR